MEHTARRLTGIARQYFRAAIKRGITTVSPFDDLPVSVRGDAERMRFIKRADIERIIEA